jgi:hypothetical protein
VIPPRSAHHDQEYSLNPPHSFIRAVLQDQPASQNWLLLTHGGFFTYCHHDAEGNCTFVIVNSGAKIWAILAEEGEIQSREDLYASVDQLLGPQKSVYGTHGVAGTIVLEPGDIM